MTGFTDWTDHQARPFSPVDEDQVLLSQVEAGSEQAFDELYRRYEAPLYRYLASLVGADSAEDLRQEVFTAVWLQAAKFKGRSRVRTWVFHIAHHQAVSWLRHSRPVVSWEELGEPSAESSPEEQAILRWQALQVHRAVGGLSKEQRVAVELIEYEDLPYRQTAALLNCPLGTVKSRVCYARRNLRQALKDVI